MRSRGRRGRLTTRRARALGDGGFCEIALGAETGRSSGTVSERVARAAARGRRRRDGAVAARAGRACGPVALARRHGRADRFAPAARTLPSLATATGRALARARRRPPVRSNSAIRWAAEGRGGAVRRSRPGWGALVRVVARRARGRARRDGRRAAPHLRYLTQREQFGRPIGSFQAVQHRLADCAVQIEGARWLAYEAAAQGAPAEGAACAAGFALAVAGRVHRETHQLSGAIGYTTEHDLHVWSLRLLACGSGRRRRRELRALARERWGAPA
jgi:hypothetical protein